MYNIYYIHAIHQFGLSARPKNSQPSEWASCSQCLRIFQAELFFVISDISVVLLLLSLSTVPVVVLQFSMMLPWLSLTSQAAEGCNEGARPLATFLVDLFVRVTFETF